MPPRRDPYGPTKTHVTRISDASIIGHTPASHPRPPSAHIPVLSSPLRNELSSDPEPKSPGGGLQRRSRVKSAQRPPSLNNPLNARKKFQSMLHEQIEKDEEEEERQIKEKISTGEGKTLRKTTAKVQRISSVDNQQASDTEPNGKGKGVEIRSSEPRVKGKGKTKVGPSGGGAVYVGRKAKFTEQMNIDKPKGKGPEHNVGRDVKDI